jgi:hypothetical protein
MSNKQDAIDAAAKAIQIGWLPTLDAKWPYEMARAAVEAAAPYLVSHESGRITDLEVAVARLIGDVGELREAIKPPGIP